MATALKLKNDIKKLKSAINSKATPKSFLPKLKAQLEKAENELASLKSGAKPRKTSTTKGTEKTLSALEKLIQKKKYSVYKGAGVDLKKDAGEGALATGRRVSKGLKANQYGSKGDNKGNVYYEYRPNRLDVKQPKKAQKYPKLEKGGMMAHGGETKSTRLPEIAMELFKKPYVELTPQQQKACRDERDKRMGLKEYGGMMAKGGQIGEYRIVPYKRLEVKGSPDLVEPYYSLAFTVTGSLTEANDKAQKFVITNDLVSATVTKIHPSGIALKNKTVSYVTKDEIQKYEDGGMMAHGGETENLQHLVGSTIHVYQMGVKEPTVETIKSIRVTDKKFSNRDVVLETEGGGVDRFPLSKLDDFLKGEDIKITGGKEPYAIELVEKMAKGAKLKNASSEDGFELVDINGHKIEEGDIVKSTQPSGGVLSPAEGQVGVVEKTKDAFGQNSLQIRFRKAGKNYDQLILLNGKINEILSKKVQSGKMAYGGELHKTEA